MKFHTFDFMGAVENKQELVRIISSHGKEISTFGVKKIAVFGSFIKNNVTPNSDVDLIIEFDPNYKTLKNLYSLSQYLQNLFGRKVEIVTLQSLNPFTGKYIIQEAEYVAIAA